jgi:hypothetical protein
MVSQDRRPVTVRGVIGSWGDICSLTAQIDANI